MPQTQVDGSQINKTWRLSTRFALMAVSGIIGLISGFNAAGIQTWGFSSDGSLTMSGSLLASSGSKVGIYVDVANQRIAVGQRTAETAVDARGTLSGSALTDSGLKSCNTIDTDASGNLSCGTDADTTYSAGQGLTLTSTTFKVNATLTGTLVKFTTLSGTTIRGDSLKSCDTIDTDVNGVLSCGTDATGTSNNFGTGNVLTLVNGHYVRTSGDTMTGALKVRSTASGIIVHADTLLQSSGSLRVDSSTVLRSTVSILGNTSVRANLSGSTLNVDALKSCTNIQSNASGLLSCNSSSYQTTALTDDSAWVGSSSNLAAATAVPNCSGNSFLQYATASNAFACTAATTYSAGQGLTLTSNVFKVNATLTGTTLRGWTTISGSTLRADSNLTSSGQLRVESSTTLRSTLTVLGNTKVRANLSGSTLNVDALKSCVNIQSDAAGALSCNSSAYQTTALTDDSAWVGSSSNLAAATAIPNCTSANNFLQYATASNAFSCTAVSTYITNTDANNRFLKLSGGTLTGAVLSKGSFSGSTVYVSRSFSGAGLSSSCNNATTSKLLWANGTFSCGTDQTSAGLSLSDGDARYVQKQGSTMTGTLISNLTSGTIGISVKQALSGSVLEANNSLTTSGSLVVGNRWKLLAVAAPATPLEGEEWNDSTMKTKVDYLAGVKQGGSYVLFTETGSVTTSNTTTTGSLLGSGRGTKTLPANFFTVGKHLRISIRGYYGTTASPLWQAKFTLGGTKIISTGYNATSASPSNQQVDIVIDVTCRTTGASGTIFAEGSVSQSTGIISRTTTEMVSTATKTIDTTVAQDIDVGWQWSTAASANTITSAIATIEVLN